MSTQKDIWQLEYNNFIRAEQLGFKCPGFWLDSWFAATLYPHVSCLLLLSYPIKTYKWFCGPNM